MIAPKERLSLNCTICGLEKDLVRDHCHKTGFIRGILCVSCNSWLGVVDKSPRREVFTSNKRLNKWYTTNKKRIHDYRKQHIGILYEGEISNKLLQHMHKYGVVYQKHLKP